MTYLQAFTGIIGVIVGALLSAFFVFQNNEIQKKRKIRDLYRLVRAEILNLKRHCSIVGREIDGVFNKSSAYIRVMKYKDGALFYLDSKEIYLLHENICQDLMQISLLSRNNDLYVDSLLTKLGNDPVREDSASELDLIRRRMELTAHICDRVLDNLDHFITHQKTYDRPAIDW